MSNRIGTVEYEDNEGRAKRIALYRQFANLPDDVEITENDINDFHLTRVASLCNRSKNKIRAELLGQEWLGENWDEN